MKYLDILNTSIVRPENEPEWESGLSKIMKSRTPRIWRMAHVVTKRLLKANTLTPQSLIVATSLGALNETEIYLDGVFKDGFGSPRSFIASVHNSMAGKLGVDFKIKGPNLTVCEGQNSFASAIKTASLFTTHDYPILLIVIDEKIDLFTKIQPFLSENSKKYVSNKWEEAAIAFLLNASETPKKPYMISPGTQSVPINQSPESKIIELASTYKDSNISILPVSETSDSFLKPAITAHTIMCNSQPGNYIIGSYSPSAKAASIVKLCI